MKFLHTPAQVSILKFGKVLSKDKGKIGYYSMSLANWNVKEKEKFSVVANPVFCFSFSFLFFFVFFFVKRYSVGPSLSSSDFKV